MSVRSVFSTLVLLLATITFFTFDAIADSESVIGDYIGFWMTSLVIILIVVGIVCFLRLLTRKTRTFLKEHSDLLSSEDPKVLLELSEKCDEFLKDNSQNSTEVARLAQRARTKAARIQKQLEERDFLEAHRDQLLSEDPKVLLELSEKCEEYLKDQQSTEVLQLLKQANLAAFKSGISEDGSHPRVISTFKEHMHNPDSFQHVSSESEDVEKDGKHYYKITMACRGTNTFGALVLQTYFFVLDEDNQISLIGSPDDAGESGSVNMERLSASVDAAVGVFEGVALAADLLSFFSSE